MGEWIERNLTWLIGLAVVLVAAAIELRIRKLVDAQEARNKEKREAAIKDLKDLIEDEIQDLRRELDPERRFKELREDLHTRLGNIGSEAMEATRKADDLGREVSELTGSLETFMRSLEQYVPQIFRGSRR